MRKFPEAHKNILLADDDSDDRDSFLAAVSVVDHIVKLTLKRDGDQLMDYLNATSLSQKVLVTFCYCISPIKHHR